MSLSARLNNIAIILFIVIIALLFRRYDAFTDPRLWAEDGKVFLQQYEQYGIRSLIMPYAGYYHTLLRILAFSVGILNVDLLYVPAAYNASAFIVAFALALYLYRCAGMLGLKHRIVFATSFLFIPLDSEIYMNLTNAVWLSQMLLVAYVFVGHYYQTDNQRWNIVFFGKLLLLFIIALTGPGALIISPVIALIIFLERKMLSLKKLVPLLVIVAAGIIQLYAIKFSGTNPDRTWVPEFEEPLHLLKFFTLNINQTFFLAGIFDGNIPVLYEIIFTALFGVLLLVVFAVLYKRVSVSRKYVPLLSAILFLASFIVSYWPNEWKVLALNSPRYYFIPYTSLALLVIISLDKKLKPVYIVAYLAFFSFHYDKITFTLHNKDWRTHVMNYKLGLSNTLPVNPDGWSAVLPPKAPPVTTLDYNDFPSDKWFGDGAKEVAMWGNGLVLADEVQLSKGEYTITVIIKGTPYEGVHPHHNVYINGEKIGDMYISSDYRDYRFTFDVESDSSVTIGIDMDNDDNGKGEDRNSFMRAIYIHSK